ncbi:MAG: hypothetical protein ACK5NB_13650 [Flavobacteriaceae bacterium]
MNSINPVNDKSLSEPELGEFLYLGMGKCNGHKVVMSVGYTPEYANKKAKQFEEASNQLVKYIDISVIKTGEKIKLKTISRQ